MAESNAISGALVVTTNHGEYYVIPKAALGQYQATPEQRHQIDEVVTAQVPGSYAALDAEDASAQPTFASESETTVLAWLQES